MWTNIDNCLLWPNGKAYFFSGDEYVRYDVASDRADPGYPKPIAANWPGLWSPVGAGVAWPNGKAYFFRGSEYLRYDIASDRVDPGYPKPIAGNWPGLSLTRVDAAVVWPTGKAYLFGFVPGPPGTFGADGYVRYDVVADRQDEDYPQSIEKNWRGLGDFVNGCLVWPNGKAYFFRGSEYLRYDIASDRVDPGYPKPIAGNWPGLSIAPPSPPPLSTDRGQSRLTRATARSPCYCLSKFLTLASAKGGTHCALGRSRPMLLAGNGLDILTARGRSAMIDALIRGFDCILSGVTLLTPRKRALITREIEKEAELFGEWKEGTQQNQAGVVNHLLALINVNHTRAAASISHTSLMLAALIFFLQYGISRFAYPSKHYPL